MGWSVSYTVEVPEGMDIAVISSVLEPYNSQLHEGCEPIWLEETSDPIGMTPRPECNYFWGSTKVQYSENQQGDFRTVLEALQILVLAKAGVKVNVSDDYEIVSGDVSQIDLEGLFT